MKGHRFSVLMLCQGARLLRFPTTQLIGRLSLCCAAALLALVMDFGLNVQVGK